MDLSQRLRDNGRLARTLLAVGLSVFALQSLRKGKRLRGVLSGLGAVAVGYGATAESGDVVDPLTDEFDTGDDHLRCAVCGDPIVVGQPRRPNENDETVHEACLEAPAW